MVSIVVTSRAPSGEEFSKFIINLTLYCKDLHTIQKYIITIQLILLKVLK